MNDDAFEKKLESLAGDLPRPDPTPQWKADILARARREAAGGTSASQRILPPRWLMMVWCAAWAGIAVLHLSTPTAAPVGEATVQIAEAGPHADAASPEGSVDPSSLTLLAFHRELSNGTTSRFDIP